jgi:hypothetical protein
VRGFWSLTLYDADHFFAPNALNRFSLGTKNKDLKYGPDGSLTIYVQHERPSADQVSNWLPAPKGDFELFIRAYWGRGLWRSGPTWTRCRSRSSPTCLSTRLSSITSTQAAHACGHNGHTAMLMGAASVLVRLRDALAGTVLSVFQPAEEGPPLGEDGGAALMEHEGALAGPPPAMVFGLHLAPLPTGVIGYRAGNQYAASVLVKIVVTGQQVHGSTPWMGVDPMPVAADIITTMGQLYRQVPASDPVTVNLDGLWADSSPA